jgi:hypothetical protein
MATAIHHPQSTISVMMSVNIRNKYPVFLGPCKTTTPLALALF